MSSIVSSDQLEVLPPRSADEPGFDGICTVAEIKEHLRHIVRLKVDDVREQLVAQKRAPEGCCIVCADTIVVATDENDQLVVLGKPPEGSWQETVRDWFRRYYSGKTHEVWTGCQIVTRRHSFDLLVQTGVTMCSLDDDLIDWYVSTEEPLGKAGGYGIQGKAAMLIEAVDCSLTNVIGLPMLEVREALMTASAI